MPPVPPPDAWYTDWPKFVPGWIALLITLTAGGRRWWVRRHKLAEGPEAQTAREQLKELRAIFEEVVTQRGRESHRFNSQTSRELVRELREIAERRTDKKLRTSVVKSAEALEEVIASAPHELGQWAEWGGDPENPKQQAELNRYEQQMDKQLEAARSGITHTTAAIDRLNKLERLTHGRS
ncbi:hypothetical protein AB0H69_00255 [Streptomyces phaeochromogenes]|uniref:hypothetical protein n=1 Tax=Streptomyces phaeochromogenes TaxID=1923 RepID=UPI0033E31EEF